MKKNIVISAIVVGLLSSVNAYGAEDLSSMFSEGKVSGEIREFSISRAVDVTDPAKSDYTRKANAIGGNVKYETADYMGLTLGVAAYTTNGFANDSDVTATTFDPTLLGPDNDNYTILGEAYLQYKSGNTTFKAGRQKLNTPLAGADDARMLPNLFEAYVLTNTDIADTTIVAAHATKFAQGTFGRAYSNGILPATAGYSATDSQTQVGEFVNMGEYAVGTATDGVSILSATYTGIKGLKVQLWDYMAHDILNAVYGQVDYKMGGDSIKPFVSAQVISENAIGDKLLGDLSGMLTGVKVGANINDLTVSLAYTQTSKNDATDTAQANAIITPWGGMPSFTQGMVTRHMNLAGTSAMKAAVVYNFKNMGTDLKTVFYYLNHAMADYNGYINADASESGFDFIYKPAAVENLQLRLRANYATDFNVAANGYTTSWNEYRFIATYKF